MPYGITANHPDCEAWATVKVEADGTLALLACHADKQSAIDQMVAVSLDEGEEPLGDVDNRMPDYEIPDDIEEPQEVETRAPSLVAPAFMASSARRGLTLHAEGKSGAGLRPQTVADARKMADGEALSEDKWRRIAPWIARHLGDLDAAEAGEITAGVVAMLLWGGGSSRATALRAQRYAERIVNQLDNERNVAGGGDLDPLAMLTPMSDVIEARWCAIGDDERRVAYTTLDLREIGDGSTLVGYAAVFDSPSEPLPFIEVVRKGAFADTLNKDVRLLIDHEGVPLARTTSGTLRLAEDDTGLRVEADLDRSNPDAQRLMSALSRGDISQMSFAFKTLRDNWSADKRERELLAVDLFDVSVVTFPAYEQTSAELRSRTNVATLPTTTSRLLRQRQLQVAKARQNRWSPQ